MKRYRPWPCLFAAPLLVSPGLVAQPAETPPAAFPSSETQPAATQPAESTPALPTERPVVTLLEAGEGPHRLLRFRPKVGVTQVIEMTVRLEMENSLGGQAMPSQKLPAMQYSMETVVNAAEEAGDISYEFEYKTANVVDEPGVNPFAAGALRNALKAIEGLRGKGIMTDRGFNKLIRFDRPPDMDPMLQQQLAEMERSMEQLVSPFPAEPVGVGAVWKVESAIRQQGMLISQTSTVTVLAGGGDRVEVRTELTQTADPQPLEVPGAPPMQLKSHKAEGATTTVLRLDRLFPETSTTNLTNDTTIMMGQSGVQQELQQRGVLVSETKTK
ncbi:MAG: hypothetical protein ACYS15_01190 [Planctomycetota bacterium]|jgi:hypothetical protein